MNGNIDQTREQVEGPHGTSGRGMLRNVFGGTANAVRQRAMGARMKAKHGVAIVVLLGTLVTSLVGVSGATGGVPRVAHADSSIPAITALVHIGNPCYVKAWGTDFTAEGRVHIDLVFTEWQNAPTVSPDSEGAPQIVASVDTTAAAAIDVPDGAGGVAWTYPGGYFETTVTAPILTSRYFNYWVVATDEATGMTATSAKARLLECG